MNAPASLESTGLAPTPVSVFNVGGMHCAGCIAKVERALTGTPGVASARVNFTLKRVRISHVPDLGTDDLRRVITDLGFTADPFLGEAEGEAARDSRRLVKAMAVAGFAAMNVMLLSVSIWSGADGATRDLFHWLSAMIALPAVAYSGRPFFTSAWAALRHGRTNMDVPISIGVILACAISLYETAISGPHAYFDGAIMLLFFLLAGRFLDSVMRARAQDSVAALLRQTAAGAMVIGADGSNRWYPAEDLAQSMRITVAAGDRIAADGIVESGRSSVDRSLITGESEPDPVEPGSRVLAGTLNLDNPIFVEVIAAGPDTVIADIARLMEAAGQSKSLYVRIADRASRLYAPAVHSLAALSFIGWMVAGAGLHQSVLIAVAVLIITCPCALGLAVPVAQVVASGALMRAGVIIKDGSALERLAEVDMALFDKTGTLTLGRPVPAGTWSLTPSEQPMALALALASRHPLARALASTLEAQGISPAHATDLSDEAGRGIEAHFDGRVARLGHPLWVDAQGEAQEAASLVTAFSIGSGPVRYLRFEDAIRPEAGPTLRRLDSMGIESLILSGDRAQPVTSVSAALDVAGHSDLSPQAKYDFIRGLAEQGRKILMVGDGLNDGPALKAAHVSIAPTSATDVGKTAADLLFFGDSLAPVASALAAARRTMRVVRQNFLLAIAYNFVAVPLAVAGFVTPLIAALAMSGSSLLVVANALRLRGAAR